MKKLVLILSLILVLITGCSRTYTPEDLWVEIEMPINTAREAAAYSAGIEEFTVHRNDFLEREGWEVESNYLTEAEHKRLFESWYRTGKIEKREYEERINWSEQQGDYWNVRWLNDQAFCVIQFRDTGELKEIDNGRYYYCGYNLK